MTPQEKAKELVMKFYSNRSRDDLSLTIYWSSAIGCALIAAEEILKTTPMYKGRINQDYLYWQQVKAEIEKL